MLKTQAREIIKKITEDELGLYVVYDQDKKVQGTFDTLSQAMDSAKGKAGWTIGRAPHGSSPTSQPMGPRKLSNRGMF
jgi:hypothetical protein